MSKPKIENLPQPEAEELKAVQAEEAQGGIMQSIEADRILSSEEFTGGLQRDGFLSTPEYRR